MFNDRIFELVLQLIGGGSTTLLCLCRLGARGIDDIGFCFRNLGCSAASTLRNCDFFQLLNNWLRLFLFSPLAGGASIFRSYLRVSGIIKERVAFTKVHKIYQEVPQFCCWQSLPGDRVALELRLAGHLQVHHEPLLQ